MQSIVIVVFDGLQPSQVTTRLMPNLAALAHDGVSFSNHHAVFPTATRINVASMMTGCNPGPHGLAGNTIVMRDYHPFKSFSALEPTLADVAQKTGAVLLAPTLADILFRYEQEYIAVGAGTTGNAYMQNPNAHRFGGGTIHPDFCLPYDLTKDIISHFGPWPKEDMPNTSRFTRAVDIMIEYILSKRKPTVSLIWSSEPDHAQHALGVGSSGANKAIQEADEQFGRLLEWLHKSGQETYTDVLVTSDHGYSTISNTVQIEALLRDAGFPAGDQPGGVTVAPNGGSVLFYIYESEKSTTDDVAKWLMGQPWCGAVIASDSMINIAGTLPANLIGYDGKRAPDLAMSFRWKSTPNKIGIPGISYSSSSGPPGIGGHGSMSPHEMRNILFARGPSFKKGVDNDTPSGSIDLTPTILRILGISSNEPMDGRPLEEALKNGPAIGSVDWSSHVHTAERCLENGSYRQEITISSVGSTKYVDSGQAWFDSTS